MAISINWATKVISVPQADLTFIGGDVYQLDSDSFRLKLKDLEDGWDGITFPVTHNHSTQVLLGGISYARIVEIINGYTITFEETGTPYVVNIIGSNNNILDVTNLGTVQLRSNNSAGLINVTELQHDVFSGMVHYDGVNGSPGTVYPAGTPLQPVDNFPDAVTIAGVRGFGSIHLMSPNVTVGAGDNVSGYKLMGRNAARTTITIGTDAVTGTAEIDDATVTGVLDGGTLLRNCAVADLDYVNGFVFHCMIDGTITLGGVDTAHFLSCYSGVTGAGAPVIDCAGDGAPLAIRDYNGGIKLTNKTGLAAVSIDLNAGQVTLDNTVVAGEIVVRGVGKLIDTSGNYIPTGAWNGATIINETINPTEMATAVWEKEINGVVTGSFGEAARSVSFQEHIHVDAINGAAGTAYPLGTHTNPVNNIADAVAIGNAMGVASISVAEDVTILATDNVDGFHIRGAHAAKSEITVQPGASTNFTQFSDCYLLGTLNGWVVVRDSMIEDLLGVQGIFHNTMINPGGITLTGVRTSHFLSCYSGVPGVSTPEINFAGTGRTCSFRDYSGGIKLVNKTGVEPVSLDMNSGQVIIDDTVTGGTIVLRGTAEWSNKATYGGGATIIDQFVEGTQVHDIHEAHFHRRVWDKVGNTITIYEDDGVTPKHVFDSNADLSDINPR